MLIFEPLPYLTQAYSRMITHAPPMPQIMVPRNRDWLVGASAKSQTGAPQIIASAHCKHEIQKSRMRGV